MFKTCVTNFNFSKLVDTIFKIFFGTLILNDGMEKITDKNLQFSKKYTKMTIFCRFANLKQCTQ